GPRQETAIVSARNEKHSCEGSARASAPPAAGTLRCEPLLSHGGGREDGYEDDSQIVGRSRGGCAAAGSDGPGGAGRLAETAPEPRNALESAGGGRQARRRAQEARAVRRPVDLYAEALDRPEPGARRVERYDRAQMDYGWSIRSGNRARG